jgi:hypothetical protein
MITIILSLLIFNFLIAEIAIFLLLLFCKRVGENPIEFLIFFNPDIFEWVRYINANPDYVKKSAFPHLPIVNILFCLVLVFALIFIKPKK